MGELIAHSARRGTTGYFRGAKGDCALLSPERKATIRRRTTGGPIGPMGTYTRDVLGRNGSMTLLFLTFDRRGRNDCQSGGFVEESSGCSGGTSCSLRERVGRPAHNQGSLTATRKVRPAGRGRMPFAVHYERVVGTGREERAGRGVGEGIPRSHALRSSGTWDQGATFAERKATMRDQSFANCYCGGWHGVTLGPLGCLA